MDNNTSLDIDDLLKPYIDKAVNEAFENLGLELCESLIKQLNLIDCFDLMEDEEYFNAQICEALHPSIREGIRNAINNAIMYFDPHCDTIFPKSEKCHKICYLINRLDKTLDFDETKYKSDPILRSNIT